MKEDVNSIQGSPPNPGHRVQVPKDCRAGTLESASCRETLVGELAGVPLWPAFSALDCAMYGQRVGDWAYEFSKAQ